MVQYIVTIVTGTIIGYGTNYLAVKMMFRPKREVKVFGKTLPFTPGVIPKQKDKLAAAIGNAVGTSLLTKDDIKSRLMGDELKSVITGKLSEMLSTQLKQEIMHLAKLDDDGYAAMKTKLAAAITSQIMQSVNSVGVGKKISEESSRAFQEWVTAEDGLKRKVLKTAFIEDSINALIAYLSEKVQEYVEKNGAVIIRAEVDKRLDTLEESAVTELLEKVDITEEKLNKTISDIYDKLVDKAVDELLAHVDIAEMIRKKIDEMDIDTLEELVMKVMKDQLNAIINIGALIGFVLALINVGINVLFS